MEKETRRVAQDEAVQQKRRTTELEAECERQSEQTDMIRSIDKHLIKDGIRIRKELGVRWRTCQSSKRLFPAPVR